MVRKAINVRRQLIHGAKVHAQCYTPRHLLTHGRIHPVNSQDSNRCDGSFRIAAHDRGAKFRSIESAVAVVILNMWRGNVTCSSSRDSRQPGFGMTMMWKLMLDFFNSFYPAFLISNTFDPWHSTPTKQLHFSNRLAPSIATTWTSFLSHSYHANRTRLSAQMSRSGRWITLRRANLWRYQTLLT